MAKRTHIAGSVQAEVLVECRRRCCICFGLRRDESEKRGQIAHLDGNPSNNDKGNLAFLCFDHHDQFDSRTSQSKGLQPREVEVYRAELTDRFSTWSAGLRRDELLNFLAFATDLAAMADAAVKVGRSVDCFGVELASRVLSEDRFDSNDSMLWMPYASALDHFASWGWLAYTQEERETHGEARIFFEITRTHICDQVVAAIAERYPQGDT